MAIFIKNCPPIGGRIRVRSTLLSPTWITTSIPDQFERATIGIPLLAVQGSAAITYGVVSGSLPQGITLTGNQLLGTLPEVTGSGLSRTFTVRATAAGNGKFTDQTFTLNVINVNALPMWTTASNLGTIRANGRITTVQLGATDSDGTVINYASVNLPVGVTMTPTGTLSFDLGTLTEEITRSFSVTATDNDGGVSTREFTFKGEPAAPLPPQYEAILSASYRVKTSVLPTAQVEVVDGTRLTAYAQTLSSSLAVKTSTLHPTQVQVQDINSGTAPAGYGKTYTTSLPLKTSVNQISTTAVQDINNGATPTGYAQPLTASLNRKTSVNQTTRAEDRFGTV